MPATEPASLARLRSRLPIALVAAALLVAGRAGAQHPHTVVDWDRQYRKDPQVLLPKYASKVFEKHFFSYAREHIVNPPFDRAKPVDQERFFRLYVARGLESIGTGLGPALVRRHSLASSWVGQEYLRNLVARWQREGVGREEWPTLLGTVESLYLSPPVRDAWAPRERVERLDAILRLYGRIDCGIGKEEAASVLESWERLLGEYADLHAASGRPGDVDPVTSEAQRAACEARKPAA